MRGLVWLIVMLVGAPAWASEPAFRVVIDPGMEVEGPISGRLMVFLLHADSPLYDSNSAANAPFFEDPQPIFGVDVEGLAPGDEVLVGDDATSFPRPASELKTGYYRVVAAIDRVDELGDWQDEAGNLYSEEFTLFVPPGESAERFLVVLTRQTRGHDFPDDVEGVRLVETRSELLSEFHGEDRFVRAAVVEPIGYDPARAYPTVYMIPGFGGSHFRALDIARGRASMRMDDPRRMLAARAFFVVPDTEGPNGHHLFADSANNGPMGEALVTELIPALERAYPSMRREAGARLVTGHSSGGWSSLWLGLTYPETFGAVWSSAPDPVDFRAFQLHDLYDDANMYTKDGAPIASYREGGAVRMTTEEEHRMEEAMGRRNTSGQQWDSWYAVFAPRAADGHPAALVDPDTGAIDHEVAEAMRAYDIGARVRAEPERYLPLFRERVRLIMGTEDNYHLEGAVRRLVADLERLSGELGVPDASVGIRLIEGADHSSIWATPEARAVPREMLEHIASLDRAQ